MNATELMLGDWVRRRWTCADTGREIVKDFQVAEIRKNWKTLYVWKDGGNMGQVEELEPIPLTPEILEKNGFHHNDIPFVQGWEQFGLTLYSGGDGYRINCGANVALIVDSVHQLQHAIRLCGIEKEIEL